MLLAFFYLLCKLYAVYKCNSDVVLLMDSEFSVSRPKSTTLFKLIQPVIFHSRVKPYCEENKTKSGKLNVCRLTV